MKSYHDLLPELLMCVLAVSCGLNVMQFSLVTQPPPTAGETQDNAVQEKVVRDSSDNKTAK